MVGRVHSIETLGTVDGPGIRYVVFLQGCPLRCLYCHNPDTWDVRGGKEMTADEILADYDRYAPYLKNGGLTLTGGEPLFQVEFVVELFRKAKARGVHTCLDTSGLLGVRGATERAKWLEDLADVTDLVMLDVKHIKEDAHKKLTGSSNAPILKFAHTLGEKGVGMWLRHVVVPGYTDKEEDLEALGEFAASLKTLKALDVLPYHAMGKAKYEALGLPYALEGVPELAKGEAVKAKQAIIRGFQKRRKNPRIDE